MRPEADPRKAEQAVRQHDRRSQAGNLDREATSRVRFRYDDFLHAAACVADGEKSDRESLVGHSAARNADPHDILRARTP